MITTKTLDKASVKAIGEDIVSALDSVAKKYGVTINYRGGSFTSSNCTYKIEVATIGDGGVVMNRERDDFIRYGVQFGLSADMIDKTFMCGGEEFKIFGLSPRKHKFPVLAIKTSNGKRFKFAADRVKSYLS